MNEHDPPNRQKLDEIEQPLAADLVAAIERARQRTASPEMVARLTAKVTRWNERVEPRSIAPSRYHGQWIWALAIAASIVMVVLYNLSKPEPPKPLHTFPVLSAVTKISLIDVGFQRIEQDLDRADAKVEEVSEGIDLAAVRVEIQATLDEFYNWSN